MVSLEFSQEPRPTVTGESDVCTDKGDGAPHPLSAAETARMNGLVTHLLEISLIKQYQCARILRNASLLK